ncbi:MAG TPA: hypothetical protein VNO84_11680 [Burkholderiaceae bacterium]|nr:hypothetical protein [Burkholderiaceae bacterium]
MSKEVLLKIGAAVGGVVIGWAGNSVTMGPRITAVESALARIELRMDQLIQVKEK